MSGNIRAAYCSREYDNVYCVDASPGTEPTLIVLSRSGPSSTYAQTASVELKLQDRDERLVPLAAVRRDYGLNVIYQDGDGKIRDFRLLGLTEVHNFIIPSILVSGPNDPVVSDASPKWMTSLTAISVPDPNGQEATYVFYLSHKLQIYYVVGRPALGQSQSGSSELSWSQSYPVTSEVIDAQTRHLSAFAWTEHNTNCICVAFNKSPGHLQLYTMRIPHVAPGPALATFELAVDYRGIPLTRGPFSLVRAPTRAGTQLAQDQYRLYAQYANDLNDIFELRLFVTQGQYGVQEVRQARIKLSEDSGSAAPASGTLISTICRVVDATTYTYSVMVIYTTIDCKVAYGMVEDTIVQVDSHLSPPQSAHSDGVDKTCSSPKKDSAGGKLDILLILDATGSMQPYIDEVRLRLGDILDGIVASGKFALPSIRVGLIGFRDHDLNKPLGDEFLAPRLALSSDISAVKYELLRLRADGGGDGPEAQSDALAAAAVAGWSDDSETTKVAIMITDSPPHGIGERGDKHPVCPRQKDAICAANSMADHGITLHVIACEPTLSDTYKYAHDFYRGLTQITGGKMIPLSVSQELCQLIVGHITETVDMHELAMKHKFTIAEGLRSGASRKTVEEALLKQLNAGSAQIRTVVTTESIYTPLEISDYNADIWANADKIESSVTKRLKTTTSFRVKAEYREGGPSYQRPKKSELRPENVTFKQAASVVSAVARLNKLNKKY
ncbi:unnamed protein product [Peniophora sp. CBMAI 1063]|nr:unnamed protein product [Peniophora sp. CBMAI 1063]